MSRHLTSQIFLWCNTRLDKFIPSFRHCWEGQISFRSQKPLTRFPFLSLVHHEQPDVRKHSLKLIQSLKKRVHKIAILNCHFQIAVEVAWWTWFRNWRIKNDRISLLQRKSKVQEKLHSIVPNLIIPTWQLNGIYLPFCFTTSAVCWKTRG